MEKSLRFDETNTELFGPNDKICVWRSKGKAVKSNYTVPVISGGRIMAWDCFADDGAGAIKGGAFNNLLPNSPPRVNNKMGRIGTKFDVS